MAQTLQFYNTANAGLDDEEYGADFVAGDTFKLQSRALRRTRP